MKTFFSETNLLRAAGLAALVTLMSLGRLVQGFKEPGLIITATFLLSLFICGAVTAWGRHAGMPGIITDRTTLLRGVFAATLLSALALPVQHLWLDPLLHRAIASAGDALLLELAYPSTTTGRLHSLLWSASFQAMFLQAAPMSLCARLTGRRDIALALCVATGAYIATKQVGMHGITEHATLFVVAASTANAAGCALFARYGLAPLMLLSAGLSAHVFLAIR